MSELEPELVFVEPAEEPAPERGVQVGRPYVEQPIADLYFDEHGPRDVLPDTDVGLGLYLDQLEAEQAEQEQQIDPTVYPPLEGLSDEAWRLTEDARFAAAQAVAQEGYVEELTDRVAKLGREFDVTSPEVIREVAMEVDMAKRELFTLFLAGGADIGQAGAAMDDADVDGAIRAALAQRRYEAVTNVGSLKDYRAGRAAQARADAVAGREYRPSPAEGSATYARMLESTRRYAERVEKRRAELERIVDVHVNKRWWA